MPIIRNDLFFEGPDVYIQDIICIIKTFINQGKIQGKISVYKTAPNQLTFFSKDKKIIDVLNYLNKDYPNLLIIHKWCSINKNDKGCNLYSGGNLEYTLSYIK